MEGGLLETQTVCERATDGGVGRQVGHTGVGELGHEIRSRDDIYIGGRIE